MLVRGDWNFLYDCRGCGEREREIEDETLDLSFLFFRNSFEEFFSSNYLIKLIHFFSSNILFVFVEFSTKMIVKENSKGTNHNLLYRLRFPSSKKFLEFSQRYSKESSHLCIFFVTQTVQSYSKLFLSCFFPLSFIYPRKISLIFRAALNAVSPFFFVIFATRPIYLSLNANIYIYFLQNVTIIVQMAGSLRKKQVSHRVSECICPIVVLVSSRNVSIADFTVCRECTRFFWYYREFPRRASERDKDRLAWKTWNSSRWLEGSNQVKKTSSCIL